MPGIGHFAVGMAAARVAKPPRRVTLSGWMCILVMAAYLPDVDVVGLAVGVPYRAPFGHRGALHSPAFALICAVVLGLVSWWSHLQPVRMMLAAGSVMVSHGLLDALTDGGLGVALLWPLSNVRYFAPWRPIPVSPVGAHAFSFGAGEFILNEAVIFLPFLIIALWPRGDTASERASGPTTG
jgi:inner membrane protein